MYRVIDTKNGLCIDSGFPSREHAKPLRNAKNKFANSITEKDRKPRFVVCRDITHPHGPTTGR